MNTRTALGNHSNLSPNRSTSRVDEQLAFVDRVCGLLIESRSMDGYSYFPLGEFVATIPAETAPISRKHFVPVSEFMRQPSLVELDLEVTSGFQFAYLQTAGHATPSNSSTPAATSDLNLNIRCMKPQFPISAQPRGSPF